MAIAISMTMARDLSLGPGGLGSKGLQPGEGSGQGGAGMEQLRLLGLQGYGRHLES